MRFQSPAKDRKPVYAGAVKELRSIIEDTAKEFDCSKSFVINTALIDYFKVKGHQRFDDVPKRRYKRRARRKAA